MDDFTIVVGTVGNGLWRSRLSKDTVRFDPTMGVDPLEAMVRGFAVDPFDVTHLLAGVGYPDFGLFESTDTGKSWSRVDSFPAVEVWRVCFDPRQPGRYFVGTRPAALHRTEDGGRSFARLSAPFAETCPAVGLPRITSITLMPENEDALFVTAEVDGVRRSLDGGETWDVVMNDLTSSVPNGAVYGEEGRFDCHFSVASAGDPALIFVSTPDGVYVSADLGTSWSDLPVEQVYPKQYHREMAVKLDDPDVIFLGVGEWVWGQQGSLLISRDRGQSWTRAELPDECNSPVWCFAQHASNPDRILACTHKGMLFGTEDGGRTWTKFRREFSEVRSIAWTPSL